MPLENLNKKLIATSLVRVKSKTAWRKKVGIGLAVLLVLILSIYLPLRGVYSSAQKLSASGKAISASLKEENIDQTKQALSDSISNINSLDGSLNWLFWLRAVPFVNGYYTDAKHLVAASRYELQALQEGVKLIEPYKVELGLTGQVTPGQDRIAQMAKILDKLMPDLDKLSPYFTSASNEVKDIDTGKYPEKFGNKVVRQNVVLAKQAIMGIGKAVNEDRALIQKAPDALGITSPKTYLLIFQNDKEIRPTGGFMTAYAFLTLDKGYVSASKSDDIYRLDEQLLKICLKKICPLTPPAPIIKYLPEFNGKPRTVWAMRDANISPDLPTAAKQFESMYKLMDDTLPFDGIIMIDTQVVEKLIKVTGPIDVFGTNYSAENDNRCNCPNVIYELEHYAEIAAKGEADRKAVLGTLMQQILARSLGSGPEKMPDFIMTGIDLANEKHIMFYMHDENLQQGLSKLNWTGEIKSVDGDYLHINDANFAGGKSNLYVEEVVTVNIDTKTPGVLKHQVSIEYKNPQIFSRWLNGILRDYVRVYVPPGSKLINSKGSDDPVTTQQDMGLNKSYFEAFVQVRPQNSRILSFEYETTQNINGKTLPLLIQKQPGAKDHRYIIKVNGQKREEFDLIADKQLQLPI